MFSSLAAFVINLDRAPDRLAAAAAQLDKTGIRWQRVTAVDGRALKPEDLGNVDLRAYARHMGRRYSHNEFACAFSHLLAMKEFLATDAAYGIILEDDFIIPDDETFGVTLATLIGNAGVWDFVKLGGIRNPWAVAQMTVSPRGKLAAPLFKCTGAVAYLVNRDAAAKIVEKFFPLTAHFDHQLDHPWRWRIKYRVVRPWIVNQSYSFASTITYSSSDNFPFYSRYQTLIYRMMVSLKRLGYNAAHKFFLIGRLT